MYMYMSCVHTVYMCVCVCVCVCVCACACACVHVCTCICPCVCPCVCSWVSTHCQVVEAARTVKEEVESTSEDCSAELIQLEVGSCPHTHTRTHTHTHRHTHTHTRTVCDNITLLYHFYERNANRMTFPVVRNTPPV